MYRASIRQLIGPALLSLLINGSVLTPLQAAAPICTDVIADLRAAIDNCDDINRDEACYGNVDAQVEPPAYHFQQLREHRPLPALTQASTNDRGVVLINFLAEGSDIELFGVIVGPMQLIPTGQQGVYTLNALSADAVCNATDPGLIIRTQAGSAAGAITFNNITIEMHSVVYITEEGEGLMTIVNLEGQITVIINGTRITLAVGEQVVVQGGATPSLVRGPESSSFFESTVLQWLANDAAGLARVHNTNTSVTEPACIGEIRFGEPITERNISPNHECLFTFCANQGDLITVDMQAQDTQLDPWLDLRGPDKKVIAFNNNRSDQSTDSLLCNYALPTDGCYTIVARGHRNASAGLFKLKLDRGTACTPPPPACEVVTHRGLNLRTGPGVAYPSKQVIAQGTAIQPLSFNGDRGWLEVVVRDTGVTGWMKTEARLLECEVQTIETILTPPSLLTPPTLTTPTSTPTPPLPVTDRPCRDCTPRRGSGSDPATPTPIPTPTVPKTGPFASP